MHFSAGLGLPAALVLYQRTYAGNEPLIIL